MARDYAKNRPPARNGSRAAPKRKAGGGMPGWVGIMLGLSVGLAVAAFVYIDRSPRKEAPLATLPATSKDEKKKPIALPPKQASRFTFYKDLEESEVIIPRDEVKESVRSGKPASPEIAAPGQYLVQVGSFKTRDEAERGRANLALLGVESRIEQVTIDQTKTWYRVRIGPEKDLAKAQEILERLKSNDIDGMLIKVKS